MPELRTEGWTKESLQHFIEGMTIVDVAYYEDPLGVHLFLVADPTQFNAPRSILAIYAFDDGTLSIDLEGPGVPESPNDSGDLPF